MKKYRSVHDVDRFLTSHEGLHSAAVALRRMVDLTTGRRVSDADCAVAREKIPVLLEIVSQAVVLDVRQDKDEKSVNLNPYALADILASLAKLGDSENLASRVCDLMDRYEDKLVRTLGPRRLVECLESLAILQLHYATLIGRMCDRLQQGDALGKLNACHLSRGLKSLVALAARKEHDGVIKKEHERVIKGLLRRLRKQAVRRKATMTDICQALYAARRLIHIIDEDDDTLYVATNTMVHTLLREVHLPVVNATSFRSLTAGQIAEIMMASSAFQVNDTNPVFDHVVGSLCQKPILERATVPDIARILLSMERLQLSRYHFVVQRLGLRFLELMQKESVDPRSANTILRSALLLHRRDRAVMEPFTEAATFLILESPKGGDPSFLSACSDVELSNFAWFLSRTRCYDEEALFALANRILEPDILESCSPKSASRVLSSFTELIESSSEEASEINSVLSQLFHGLGTHLLTAQLTPAETSATLLAYAKASYIQDMGIFDHLADHLGAIFDRCSIRQVCEGLWACGKMMAWESDKNGEIKSEPPYFKVAREYAAFLASRATQLTAKDVSQAIWASGRLGIADLKIVCAFAYRARQVAPNCTSQEVAIILWGLSKVGYNDRAVILALTDRMIDLHPSSQEAATVLYALGRMDIRDDIVFSSMGNIMMEQLETASAQAVANALWAYRTVHIAPPQTLLDSWAIQKLGLDGVQPYRIDDL